MLSPSQENEFINSVGFDDDDNELMYSDNQIISNHNPKVPNENNIHHSEILHSQNSILESGNNIGKTCIHFSNIINSFI